MLISSGDKSSKSSNVSTPSVSATKSKNPKTLQQSKSGTSTAIKHIEKDLPVEPQIIKESKEVKEAKINKEELDTKESKESYESQSVKDTSFDTKLISAKPNVIEIYLDLQIFILYVMIIFIYYK